VDWRVGNRGFERSFLFTFLLASACATGGTPGDAPDGGLISSNDAGDEAPDATPMVDAGPTMVDMTQSTSMTGEAGSIACIGSVNGVPQNNRDNSYYRIFDLPALGITNDLLVSKVAIGIESATAGVGTTQPINVKLHTLSGSFVAANLTQLVSAPVQVANQTATVLDVNMSATVPGGSLLVVEVEIPDADGGPNHLFFIGSNTLGESAPSYLRSTTCGFAEPVPISTLSVDDGMGGTTNPTMHLIMSVTGTH